MSIALKAEKREKLGSAEARKIKRAGRIPAVIYSKDGNINLSVDVKEFEHEFYKGSALTSVFELDFAGKKMKVVAHKVEVDPVSDHPCHIDFVSCEAGAKIIAKPKLIFVNQDKSPGLKKGGFLHIVLRKVEVLCDNEKAIPHAIEVDVGQLQVTQKVRANNLKLPAGVQLAKKDNFLVASITGRGKADEAPAAGDAAAATPAAGAAAPAAGAAAKAPAKDEKKADKK